MVFVNFFLVPACIYAMAGAYFYTWSIGIKQATVARKKMAIHIYARVQSKQMVHKSRQKKCNWKSLKKEASAEQDSNADE